LRIEQLQDIGFAVEFDLGGVEDRHVDEAQPIGTAFDRNGDPRDRSIVVLRKRKLRRTIGALLAVAGGVLMWLAPESTFDRMSFIGVALLVLGIALEAVGIALEYREK
jgi:hypothetical protein